MGDTLQIVDSIASSPTVLFDLNNESPSGAFDVDVSPPGLRYTTSSSMLADGSRISSSSYENRTISLGLDFISASQDAWASSWQTLARLLDQEQFWLKYQPTGATSPVFFNCYRSQVPSIQDMKAAAAYRQPSLSIPADPAAYGLPVDISSFVITINPSTGTNRAMVGPSVLGTIKGDLETPLILATTAGSGFATSDPLSPFYLSSYTLGGGFTHTLLARNLTELTSGTDTGASVTGAGTNYIDGDYKACTFATVSALGTRLSGTFSTSLLPMPGLYRVLMRYVESDTAASAHNIRVQFRLSIDSVVGDTYTDTNTTFAGGGTVNGRLIDFGLWQIPVGASAIGAVGLGAPASAVTAAPTFTIEAGATALTGSLTNKSVRFDELYLLPVDTNYGDGTLLISNSVTATNDSVVFDGVNDSVRVVDDSGSGPFASVPRGTAGGVANWVGGLPVVRPGSNNYVTWLAENLAGTASTAKTTTLIGRYYPRYLYVRPAST